MAPPPLLALIHHNRPDLTRLAVRSIRDNTPPPYRLLIIDNASGHDVAALAPDELIVNQTRLSFARNCNLGIEAGRGSRIVLLNNDVFCPPGWLEGLLSGLDRGLGLAGAVSNAEIPLKMNLAGQPLELGFQVDPAAVAGCREDLAKVLGEFNFQGRGRPPRLEPMVCFFAAALSRRVVDRVGLLDEAFVHGFEDLDYCWRAWGAGLAAGLADNAYVVHFGGQSTPGADPVELGRRDRVNLPILLAKYEGEPVARLLETWKARGLEPEGRRLWDRIKARAAFLGLAGAGRP
ncbi:MAG: glycosyltransferase [Pseudomonadota bacterium]